MIAIIDYGAGNLFSVQNALNYLDIPNIITSDKKILQIADSLILPGVGAFPDAMQMLEKSSLIWTIQDQAKRKPLLGICLGMQILFETGYEFSKTAGLGLIKGDVRLMTPENLVVPHMGWNVLIKNEKCPLLEDLGNEDYVYFVHSYAAVCDKKNVAAYTEYGGKIPAMVFEGNVFGCQFHPEKSGAVGLKILKRFASIQ